MLIGEGAPIVGLRDDAPKLGLPFVLAARGDCEFDPGPDPPLELLCRAEVEGRFPFDPLEACLESSSAGGGNSSGETSSPFARDLAAEMNESR